MRTRIVVIAIIVVAIVAILALTATAIILQPHPSRSSFTTTGRTSTTTYAFITPTFSVPLLASSVNNSCFVNSFNASITIDNGIYYSCFASLRGNQSIKQNIFRAYQLFGNYSLSVNASQIVIVSVVESGAIVYSGSGGAISYRGSVKQNQPMYITVRNSETTSTNYTLGIDFPNAGV